jgi:PEP-CTERM motif-containing protein
MKVLARISCIAAMVAVFAANNAPAQVAVYYSFNNTNQLNGTTAGTNAFLAADTGSAISTFTFGSSFREGSNGTATAQVDLFAGTTVNAQPGFVAGNTASSNGSLGDANSYVQFTLDATGLQNLIVSWAGTRSTSASNAGAGTNTLEYSTDGGSTFNIFQVNAIPAATASGAFIPFTNDLTAVTALNGNASDVFRVYYSQAYIPSTGLQSTAGTERMDNLTINASAIPEPSTILLVGAGLAGMIMIRRRRS